MSTDELWRAELLKLRAEVQRLSEKRRRASQHAWAQHNAVRKCKRYAAKCRALQAAAEQERDDLLRGAPKMALVYAERDRLRAAIDHALTQMDRATDAATILRDARYAGTKGNP